MRKDFCLDTLYVAMFIAKYVKNRTVVKCRIPLRWSSSSCNVAVSPLVASLSLISFHLVLLSVLKAHPVLRNSFIPLS